MASCFFVNCCDGVAIAGVTGMLIAKLQAAITLIGNPAVIFVGCKTIQNWPLIASILAKTSLTSEIGVMPPLR